MSGPLRFVLNDGGRGASGFKGSAGDCACRAIAIAGKMTYREAYTLLSATGKRERKGKRKRSISHPRTGVYRQTMRWLLVDALGWAWTPTMGIGTGCTVHLAEGELPSGNLIVSLSKHYAAVIDGVVYDTHDPCRDGTRCVYGYWSAPTGEDQTFTRKLPQLIL